MEEELKKEIEDLKVRFNELEVRMNTHGHTGADLTERIVLEDVYLGGGNEFFFQLPNSTADPTVTVQAGAINVVNGDLKIYNGSAWELVGVQT